MTNKVSERQKLYQWLRQLPPDNMLNEKSQSKYIVEKLLSKCFDDCEEFETEEFMKKHAESMRQFSKSGGDKSIGDDGSSNGSIGGKRSIDGSSTEHLEKMQKTED